jgi:hypothetical protein
LLRKHRVSSCTLSCYVGWIRTKANVPIRRFVKIEENETCSLYSKGGSTGQKRKRIINLHT